MSRLQLLFPIIIIIISFLETLRKYPPVPIIAQKCNKEFQYDINIKLPKDNLILVPIIGIHRDPLNYSNPEKFDPDRFIEDTFKPETFLPFGYNLRKNIGKLYKSIFQIFRKRCSLFQVFSLRVSTLKWFWSAYFLDLRSLWITIILWSLIQHVWMSIQGNPFHWN